MIRYLKKNITADLDQKIILLTGPRQCGKTTLAKNICNNYDYFNYDAEEDRLALKEKSWDRNKQLVIFDELHKMKEWKKWLKGIYDTEGLQPNILVTGSAKLDTYRKVGDSLAGRYFQFQLHPLDIKEAMGHFNIKTAEDAFHRLWHCSGFPEPFIKGSETYYKRWRRSHLDIILRQDLIDLHSIKEIQSIETLVLLLKQRVGSCISYSNLARDLQHDPNTIKRWLQLLENLYIIFRVTPYSNKIARAILKESKYYFYDHAYAENSDGARLENIVACALLKALQYIEDTKGIASSLHFIRTKEGKEIDFLITMDNKPTHLIEVKTKESSLSPHFNHFMRMLPNVRTIQLVKDIQREKTFPNGLEVRNLIHWLANLALI